MKETAPPVFLIIEDEPAAANRLASLIRRLHPEAVIPDVQDSIEGAVEWLGEHHPDLIFMDVQLADGLCFDIFDRVEVTAPVIFTTAFDAYALKAFRVQALDYLLKPVKESELEEALLRYRDRQPVQPDPAHLKAAYAGLPGAEYRQRFLVKLGAAIRVIEIPDIAFIYTEAKNTFVMTREGRRFPMDFSLEALEKQLDPDRFFRANRQYILARESIGDMFVHSKSRVRVQTQPAAPSDIIVSTEKSAQFKRWLAGNDEGSEG